MHSVCPGWTEWKLLVIRNALSWDGKLREFSMWSALRWPFCLQASRDYIGMAVVDGQLTSVYNLGGREAELQVGQTLTRSETQEAVMDRVKFQRCESDWLLLFVNLTYTRQTFIVCISEPHF